jgi:hypothetical protein
MGSLGLLELLFYYRGILGLSITANQNLHKPQSCIKLYCSIQRLNSSKVYLQVQVERRLFSTQFDSFDRWKLGICCGITASQIA